MEDGDSSKFTPDPISYNCTKKIIEQMDKNIICRIKIGEIQSTGFFCRIPVPNNNNMVVLITSYISLSSDITIKIEGKNKDQIINLSDRKMYSSKKLNTSIIEIKREDNINNYFELDNKMINLIKNKELINSKYCNETIYMIHYQKSVSYGIIKNIYYNKDISKFKHNCTTKSDSLGSPILNLNNKVIGLHISNSMGIYLYYPIKNFIKNNYFNDITINVLINFNCKYNIDIKDTNIDQLELENKGITNDIFGELNKLNFKGIKILNLCRNNISSIEGLEKLEYKLLENLNLGRNNINNIDILENENFKELKILNFNWNKIENISVLKRAKFQKLENLDLGRNKINDIDILKDVNFKELKALNLYLNQISEIGVLAEVDFQKLEQLNLGVNQNININILKEVNFQELKELKLYNNNISNIELLKNIKFKKLEILDLGNNGIENIGELKSLEYTNLKELFLYHNKISNIEVFKEVKFDNLKKLNLSHNKISNIKVFGQVKFKGLEILDLGDNQIEDITEFSNVELNGLKELNLNDNQISDIAVFGNVKFNLEKLNLSNNKINNNKFNFIINKLKLRIKEFYI